MRKILLLLTIIINLTTHAQETADSMYIYRNDNMIDRIAVSLIDSVTFVAPQATEDSTPYKAVDLGLSVRWASCNIGATSPEEYGGYYAWGETEGKEDYSWETYKWCNGSYETMTKYCIDNTFGTVDNKKTLEPEDDVATVEWGGSWRMPTQAEQDELRNNCTWTWTTLNNVTGYTVTGPNGNSIFLPATGFKCSTKIYFRNKGGYYWSSDLYDFYNRSAGYLFLYSSDYDWYSNYRLNGYSVRAVCK